MCKSVSSRFSLSKLNNCIAVVKENAESKKRRNRSFRRWSVLKCRTDHFLREMFAEIRENEAEIYRCSSAVGQNGSKT